MGRGLCKPDLKINCFVISVPRKKSKTELSFWSPQMRISAMDRNVSTNSAFKGNLFSLFSAVLYISSQLGYKNENFLPIKEIICISTPFNHFFPRGNKSDDTPRILPYQAGLPLESMGVRYRVYISTSILYHQSRILWVS